MSKPHAGQPVLTLGPKPKDARLAMILVHGRGASAEDILQLASEFGTTDVAYLAPQASGHSWYPSSFLSPIARNEPHLSAALDVLHGLVATLGAEGVPADRVGFLGFSQGACLSLEFVARHARRYAALIGLSGGLIGPPGTPRDYKGSVGGTYVFLGCSDVDPHIPLERVQETAEVFRGLRAVVDERIYRRMGHTVNHDEIEAVKLILAASGV